MSRRNISKKKFPVEDPIYNNLIVSLLIARIIKKGKKSLANNIIKNVFEIIEKRTNLNPIKTFEKAIKNVTPIVEVKACRIGGSTYQVPIEVSGFRGTTLSLTSLVFINSYFSLGFQVLNNLSKVLITFLPIFKPVKPASSDRAHSRPLRPNTFLSSLDNL